MKFGVADFGMNQWYGGCHDPEARWADLKRIGYDGIERIYAISADDAMWQAAAMRKVGADFGLCLGPNPATTIRWTAALGKTYVWTGGGSAKDLDGYCRQAGAMAEAAARFGVKASCHNHMGSPVETQEQLEEFLRRCPACGLILDTAHLAGAGGDALAIAKKYVGRLVALHLKDYLLQKPDVPMSQWTGRGRFCELGAGNVGLDNLAVLKAAVAGGFDGWVFIEQDTHLQDPLIDLAKSREYLRKGGF
jgi:sugar phosphate isomerase/epimerase